MSVASAPEDLTLFLNEETVSNFENTVPVVAQSEINVKQRQTSQSKAKALGERKNIFQGIESEKSGYSLPKSKKKIGPR